MVDVKVRIKDGCRGGREQFTWGSIKEQEFKDRESYLGQSTKVGQMGKFGKYYLHDWYARKRDTTASIAEERGAVQAYEEELMQEALGLKPKKLLLAKKQMNEEELKEFLKAKKNDEGREAMGPQKKVMRNELGEEVVTSNEDQMAQAVRDGTLKGLGFASHRDAKLERIKAQTLGTESELKGLKELPKAPVKGEVMKLEVKTEVKTEIDAVASGSSKVESEVKDEAKEEEEVAGRSEDDTKAEKKDKKEKKKDKKAKKAAKKLKKMEKKVAKKEKKAKKEAKLLQIERAMQEAGVAGVKRKKSSSSSSS
ncbi:unnamed protein product [Durusdinium trenchii]|uniref:Multiple myeloma tumor-associated protein 2-like N-terminal domain-containing protein n=1 Tax=Durusdinium trenchii TaxID=1381693 RepID=A0ABP0NRB7_9DINO